MKQNKTNLSYLTKLALLTALTLVLAYTPIGYLPLGPLNVSFLTIPVGVGAILLGPAAGGFLGAVFGLTSFANALTGGSVMGATLLAISPIGYFVVSVIGRVLMGLGCGWIFRALTHKGKPLYTYAIGAVSAPLLNTTFFMGLIVALFYQTEYIQGLVDKFGVTNPLSFILAMVGVQGLVEAMVCGALGCIITKTVDASMGKKQVKPQN